MVERHKLTFPVVHDEGRVLAGRLRLTELPATVIADKRGLVRWVGTRALSAENAALRIPVRRVDEGGFAYLRSIPGGSQWAERWWTDAITRAEMVGDR